MSALESRLGEFILGETGGRFAVDRSLDNMLVSTRMVSQARFELLLFSRDLAPAVYDRRPFLDALKRFALRGRRPRVRILVQDPTRAVKYGHRLIELSRRGSSAFEVRRVHSEFLNHPESFLLADRTGYIRRPLATQFEAVVDFHSPLETGRLADFFMEVWEVSEPDPEMRRLHL